MKSSVTWKKNKGGTVKMDSSHGIVCACAESNEYGEVYMDMLPDEAEALAAHLMSHAKHAREIRDRRRKAVEDNTQQPLMRGRVSSSYIPRL